MKKAIVLGGTSAHIPLLQNLKQRGFFTLLVDYYDLPVALPYADRHYRISTLDQQSVLSLARAEKVQLVISTCVDQANVTACYVAEMLQLPAPYSYETALMVTDKVLMKRRLQEAGITTPKYIHVSGPETIGKTMFPFPLIVKPVDACGSKGVRIAETPEDLAQFYRLALQAGRTQHVMIEEFVSGREIVLDTFVQNGHVFVVSIYEKFNIYSKKMVVQCFRSLRPVALPADTVQRLKKTAENIVHAFGLQATSLFVQTIVNEEGIHVIEFGARAAGGLACRATQLQTGFDAVDATINSFLGLQTAVTEQNDVLPQIERAVQSDLEMQIDTGHLYSTNSIYASPGIFDRVCGQNVLMDQGVIHEFACYKSKGMPIRPGFASSERIAGFIVKAIDKDELFDKTDMALKNLQVWNERNKEVMIRDPFIGVKNHHLLWDEELMERL